MNPSGDRRPGGKGVSFLKRFSLISDTCIFCACSILLRKSMASYAFRLIQKCTGAVVITRSKCMQPSCTNLVVSSSSESSSQSSFQDLFELLSLTSPCWLDCFCVAGGLDLYMQDLYIHYIMNEAGATVVLRGRGSEHHDSFKGRFGVTYLH
ncbi:hypothetical protein GW17_00058888 [Ensete ventricosum]|nr:hypothetical protein GW17_00058888 [Ensete ventricosum]RZS22751.1 hypothetical protein BHM03_00055571 [Ensete ventricosum]